jgi:3-isopropylmalate/(R)-2-methylmalate dehydratase small subunit
MHARWGPRTMERFTALRAVAAPVLQQNVDTDTIIPMSRMVGTSIRGTLGQWCLAPMRYLADGSDNPAFVLNRDPYRAAQILLTGPNFGCGSSREAAVWALEEIGISCIIGSSFGDIFFNNCFQNGLLPVVVDRSVVEDLAAEVEASQGAGMIAVDLAEGVITAPSGRQYRFEVQQNRKEALLLGLDEIGQTLRHEAAIAAFQARDRESRPWIYTAEVSR